MARKPDITNEQKYIQSGYWKCTNSPTGAHHWKEYSGLWVCKYCGDVRKWPKTFYEAMEKYGKKQPIPLNVDKGEIPRDNFKVPKRMGGKR